MTINNPQYLTFVGIFHILCYQQHYILQHPTHTYITTSLLPVYLSITVREQRILGSDLVVDRNFKQKENIHNLSLQQLNTLLDTGSNIEGKGLHWIWEYVKAEHSNRAIVLGNKMKKKFHESLVQPPVSTVGIKRHQDKVALESKQRAIFRTQRSRWCHLHAGLHWLLNENKIKKDEDINDVVRKHNQQQIMEYGKCSYSRKVRSLLLSP